MENYTRVKTKNLAPMEIKQQKWSQISCVTDRNHKWFIHPAGSTEIKETGNVHGYKRCKNWQDDKDYWQSAKCRFNQKNYRAWLVDCKILWKIVNGWMWKYMIHIVYSREELNNLIATGSIDFLCFKVSAGESLICVTSPIEYQVNPKLVLLILFF